ncbi:hypothetical protein SY88_14090 [Clostridiales bacterium PH28_bin88]|nr:hypothetical protein SY88_14090 [Clostridiales bacterium PH28_bin88]
MGFWRKSAHKYSVNWFLAIHLTVPLIILMRMGTGITYAAVPLLILAALIGQLLGSFCYRWADRTVLANQQRSNR